MSTVTTLLDDAASNTSDAALPADTLRCATTLPNAHGWSELIVWSTSDTHFCCARLHCRYVSSRSATTTVYSRACLCTSTLCTGSCALDSFIVSLRLIIVPAAKHYAKIAGITICVHACEIHLCRRPPFQMNHSESRRVDSLGGTS